MKRLFALLLALALIPCAAYAMETPPAAGEPEAALITALGTSSASFQPDGVTLRFWVRGEGETVELAQQKSEKGLETVTASLTQAGVAAEDLRISPWYVEALYDYHYTKMSEHEVINGYRVQAALWVNVRDISAASTVVSTAISNGAAAEYDYTLSSAQSESAYQQALAQAVQNAVTRAGCLAQGCGMELGEMVSLREIAPGEPERLTVTATVEVSFRVKEPASHE